MIAIDMTYKLIGFCKFSHLPPAPTLHIHTYHLSCPQEPKRLSTVPDSKAFQTKPLVNISEIQTAQSVFIWSTTLKQLLSIARHSAVVRNRAQVGNICEGNKSTWCCVCQWHLGEPVGIKKGKTKRPDIIICFSFKHTHTQNENKASLFQGNISGRKHYSILIAAGVVAQQGNRRHTAMK